MENFFGSLSVFMFVTLPAGRDKRVNLATFHCEYAERSDVFRQFIEANPQFKHSALHAEFKFSELVR